VVSIVANGDRVATEANVSGTETGAWVTGDGEIAPTGRPVTIRTCDVVRVTADGLTTENRRDYDVVGVLRPLGLEEFGPLTAATGVA
jgi:hypothetical protein